MRRQVPKKPPNEYVKYIANMKIRAASFFEKRRAYVRAGNRNIAYVPGSAKTP
jgi:hypothetical protein